MKYVFVFAILIYSSSGFSKVEVCQRRAEILKGLVNHYWIKTDTKDAGMGSDDPDVGQIGDKFEAPFITKVFIVDHSNQIPTSCKEKLEVDEDCVNDELDLGKPLGRFGVTNNCLIFVKKVIKKCSPQKLEPEVNRGEMF